MHLSSAENARADFTDADVLALLHLADSALPIGGMAHSFGIEGLTSEADLDAAALPAFFRIWLRGAGRLEASFCMRAAAAHEERDMAALQAECSSFKLSRETREGSIRLGRRFLALAADLLPSCRRSAPGELHLCLAFGIVGANLRIDRSTVAAAYVHQSLFGAISACQRLLPFGQGAAMRLLWTLKPEILDVVREAAAEPDTLWNLQPALELASMRHPHLHTRLFIS